MSEPMYGTYTPSIDSKGRMSFPTKLREILGTEFYLCIGYEEPYIAVYSVEGFNDYCAQLQTIKGSQGLKIRRKLISGADKQTPDKQGRIFISQLLRNYAGITNEVIVVGNVNRAEIWNPEKFYGCDEEVDHTELVDALEELTL